jgi:site-specific DNA-methyltransferase (adenine-specific)
MAVQLLQTDARHLPLADKSVDLVFGSPPYEAQRTYGIGFNLRGQDWVDFMVEVFREGLRICRGLVAMVLEGYTKDYRWSATPAILMADLHRAGIHLRKPPIFHRVGIPGSGGPDWLRNDYEFIICATNGGKLPWSKNTAMGHPPKWAPGGEMSHRLSNGARVNQWGAVGGKRGMGSRTADGFKPSGRPSHKLQTRRKANGERLMDGLYTEPVKANPGNVLKCKVGGGLMGHKLAHENEAPFPQSLPEFFIRSFCPPNGLVLDPFSGSATTGAAAVKWGRNYIGCDIRQSQCELGKRRLDGLQPMLLESSQ